MRWAGIKGLGFACCPVGDGTTSYTMLLFRDICLIRSAAAVVPDPALQDVCLEVAVGLLAGPQPTASDPYVSVPV
jgi:hypothetical protein